VAIDFMRINWDNVKKFTPQTYLEYQMAPIWEIDSPNFNGPEDYSGYYCQLLQGFAVASKAIIGRWQQRGKQSARALEQSQNPSTPIFDFDGALAAEPLPIAKAQVDEKVALLASNPPQPMVLPQQEEQKEYCAALNQLMDMVLEDNDYELLVAKGYYDIQFWNTAIYKWVVDDFEPGILNSQGRIILERISPEVVFFDPKCKELNAKYMDYIVQKHEMEKGEIQHMYPFVGDMVSDDADELISDTSVSARNNEDYIQSPQPKLARDAAGKRQKITVLECWIRDSRLKFEPLIKDGKSDNYEERFKLDEDGYIIGNWVPRYPNGRLIICTRDVILKDMPNPFAHGQFPFVFAPGAPASQCASDGDANRIMTVTRKYNDIIADIHRYYQSEIKRPMHAEAGAILDPNLAQQVPNDPSYIIELAPNKALVRPPAMDIPPLAISYLQGLQGVLDTVSGSSGVMRGNISDGAQLSAEALANLQNYASSRLALSAKMFNGAMKQLFYQLMWLLRQYVKQNIKVNVVLPDGTTKPIDWASDRKTFELGDPTEIQNLRKNEDYLITLKAGTGNPGAQQQQQAQSLALFREGAIDQKALLDGLQYPGRQDIITRMRAEKLQDIESRAIGKELGIALEETAKQKRPGRRTKD
jgi:hypothetical protein